MPSNKPNGGYYQCFPAMSAHLAATEDDSFTIDDDAGETWICRPIEAADLSNIEMGDENRSDEPAPRIVFCESIDDLPMKLAQSQQAPTEASYICDSCGEEIVIPIDLSEGESQNYVE